MTLEKTTDIEFHRAEELLQRYFDGDITDEEATELSRLWDSLPDFGAYALRNMKSESTLRFLSGQDNRPLAFSLRQLFQSGNSGNPGESEAFLNEINWSELVVLANESQALERPSPLPTAKPPAVKIRTDSKRKRTSVHTGILALTVLLLLLGGVWMEFGRQFSREKNKSTAFHPVAEVSATAGIVWKEKKESFKMGQQLEPARFQFEEGLMELQLHNGVRLVLEGPIDFRINAPGKTFLQYGKLSATVPISGKGFAVTTPWAKLIDHGTEFSLFASDKEIEVHTLTGRTELTEIPSGSIEIEQGNAVQVDAKGNRKAIEVDPKTFMNKNDVQERVWEESTRKLLAWKDASEKWNDDPGLLIRFDFENVTRTVPSVARNGRVAFAGASVNGTGNSKGRWNGKRGLYFRNKNDTVDFDVPVRLQSVTLIASVRVESLDRFTHCLLASKKLDAGALFWQLERDGTLQLVIQASDGKRAVKFASPPIFSRSSWGAWYQLATVLDADTRTVTHYLDGELIAGLPIEEALPIHLGSATLGNGLWNVQTPVDRSFRGDFDEFLLFDRALTPQEIASMINQ